MEKTVVLHGSQQVLTLNTMFDVNLILNSAGFNEFDLHSNLLVGDLHALKFILELDFKCSLLFPDSLDLIARFREPLVVFEVHLPD